MCGAWWDSGCAAVDSTWCWLVMAMIGMMIVGGIGVEDDFQWRSNISLMRVAGGKGGTEQWWGGHHWRLHWSHPMIVLWKECDQAWTMTGDYCGGDALMLSWQWWHGGISEAVVVVGTTTMSLSLSLWCLWWWNHSIVVVCCCCPWWHVKVVVWWLLCGWVKGKGMKLNLKNLYICCAQALFRVGLFNLIIIFDVLYVERLMKFGLDIFSNYWCCAQALYGAGFFNLKYIFYVPFKLLHDLWNYRCYWMSTGSTGSTGSTESPRVCWCTKNPSGNSSMMQPVLVRLPPSCY